MERTYVEEKSKDGDCDSVEERFRRKPRTIIVVIGAGVNNICDDCGNNTDRREDTHCEFVRLVGLSELELIILGGIGFEEENNEGEP